jgi:hypothetical protein
MSDHDDEQPDDEPVEHDGADEHVEPRPLRGRYVVGGKRPTTRRDTKGSSGP